MAPKKIAVTGSSGLIGSALVAHLQAQGHQTVPITRHGDHGIHWDPDRHEIAAGQLEGLDAVVHLAGAGIADRRWTDERKHLILASRVEGTTLLAQTLASLQRPPKVLLSASAIGYYGDRGDEPLTESAGPGNGFLPEVCVRWEASTAAAAEAGIRVAHLRTGVVLDRHGGMLKKLLPLYRLGLGGPIGSGRQQTSWITLRDEVAIIGWLLDQPIAGPVNLTAPNPVAYADFSAALGRALHRPAFLRVPRSGPRLLLGRELADELLFASARVLPSRLQDGGYQFIDPTIDLALGDLRT